MRLDVVDDEGRLFISPAIDEWSVVRESGISVIVDLDNDIDHGVPTLPGSILYVYFPISDAELPDLHHLNAIGSMGATLHRAGHRVLSHCGMGLNRSALLAGVILHQLGWAGEAAVARLRERRPGALFNERFCEYLMSLPARPRLGTTTHPPRAIGSGD
jgi:protein-tyrosine phosphatase